MNHELDTLIENLIAAGGIFADTDEAYKAHDELASYCDANYTVEVFATIKAKIPNFNY